MTRCVRCGRMLSSRQVRYCSNMCKQADYRDRIPFNRLADQALTVLRPSAESLIAGGDMSPGFDWRDRVAFIETYYPEVWSTFGEDVLAASARPMPATACRWCWAFATARRSNRKSVLTRALVSTAARRLLGDPCSACQKRAFATLKRHVDAGRRPKNSGDATRSTTSHRDGGVHHVNRTASPASRTKAQRHANCVVCAALTAGAAPAVSTDRHPPWFTSVEDYERWVHAGRPERWPA